MPEEVKLSSYVTAKDYKSDYCSADDSHPESSIYADQSDREMSRSDTSSCSDESSCYKQNGHETVEIIPTRTIKTSVPKPAANPLQFVKIGPCDLYRSAQKQIQKVSEVKKPKQEVKDEVAEDWQSNLDSWKCNRRKQQEHIIERVVEVKKLELEEHDRNRKRTKTFSEMMEERTSKGRKTSLPVYLEEDNDDLSDLGISPNKNRNEASPIPEEDDEENHDEIKERRANGKCNGHDESDQVQNTNCEATYESAIQSYETRMKSLTSSSSESKKSTMVAASTTTNTKVTGLRKYGRRASATKIEEKLTELERIRNRSVSSTDLTESNKKSINIPKVNIFKRKEIFEKFSEANEMNRSNRLSDEIPPVRSLRERLSSLGKTIEETMTTTIATAATAKSKNALVPEVSVKDRLSLINKKISKNNACLVPEKSACRERLSRSKMSNEDEVEKKEKSKEYVAFEMPPPPPPPPPPLSSKPEEILSTTRREYNSSERSSSSEDYDHIHQMNHFHHRSLDSLQGHDSPNGFCFERVQSLECIDCCSNYPASVLSGDTDREDSGIHTADVSSSVSQADDFDLHADTSMDVDVKSQNATALINDDMKVDKSSHSDFCYGSQEAESLLEDVHESVDVTVIKGENQYDNFDLKQSTTVATMEANSTGKQQLVKVNQKHDAVSKLNEVRDENQKVNDQPIEEDPRKSEDVLCLQMSRQNHDASCDNTTEPRKEQDCWTADCKSAEQENANECVEDDSVEESINPVLNREHLDKPSKINEHFTKIEKECISKMESNVTNQNFDYMYMMNNKFEGKNGSDFSKSNSIFAFEPSSVAVEPPKEKPPPPPLIDNSDEELDKIENSNGLRRMDSTKRIKKEMRQKRSSFLGIEGYDDDSYLEPELEAVKPPPDMTTFLQEESRLEKLFYRQSICSESDSTQGESRDSGVELDKNHNEENSWMPERTHSRQDSEIYANTSTTSEEDEIIKKEREILEILELEEQRNYETGTKNECNYLGEKLVLKLKELEHQKNAVYWDQGNDRPCLDNQRKSGNPPTYQNYEILERKHHQLHETAKESADPVLLQQQWAGRSLQDISKKETPVSSVDNNQLKTRLDYRNSMPNIQQEARTAPTNHHRKQPPPIPANKPTHFKEQLVVNRVSNPQQMSKQTLQALSAVPRSKIVATDSWVQTKKKPRQEAYNYQHWLIQEAEHRRITEYQERQCKENAVHNYVNVHTEYSESAPLADASALESRIVQQHPNRVVTYSHPQLLPYRNQSQTCNNTNEYKSPTKMQYNNNNINSSNNSNSKPLPDSVIQTLTQRVQNRFAISDAAKQRRQRESYSNTTNKQQEKMLSVSGKKKCSHCGEELGRGAAMIIESLRLFYHIDCFRCCVCCVQLGDGLMGTDVRVRNSKLHCHSCYSNDEGLKFSCV